MKTVTKYYEVTIPEDKITGFVTSKSSDLKIVEIIDVNDENVETLDEEKENTLDLLNKYIQDADFDLDKNLVKNIIKDVYQEAYRIE